MNQQLAGTSYPPVEVEVGAERVRRFARAVGAPAGGVPPTFATVGEFAAFPQIISDPELGLDFTRVVHGDQEYEWRRPFVEGESLTAFARIASIRQRGTTGFLTIETELRDTDGELVATARSTMIERGES